ncbi:MAG TPA: sulfatase-like hydrolase/transferase [Bryobacteraceae bacterium]|nr:sulfatase-like hydrolase/transferase [Bryobacteraceae bacterium]
MGRRAFLMTPLFAASAVTRVALAAEKKPNIVLVIARGWRGVSTPFSGDPDIQAPNLEKFGEDSAVFPRAYCCDPRPAPARSAILTGLYPHSNGVTDDNAGMRVEEVTIGAALRTAGYQSGTQLDFLDAAGAGPFFLNLSLEAAWDAKPVDAAKLHLRENVPAASEATARKALAGRYGAYRAMDEQFGRVLHALDRLNLADNTIVVFTSDCGDQLGSHGLTGDGAFYEEAVRVPLAIRFPRVIAHGFKSDVLASHADIMPTLLGFCGEPSPDGIQGNDLSPLLVSGQGDRPELVFLEGRIGQKDEWRALVLGLDKAVVDAQGAMTHLFNLADDPYEMTNLAHDPALQLKRDQLLAQLRAERQRLLDFSRR